jgi:DNA-binding NarL/FixJ family response regulator
MDLAVGRSRLAGLSFVRRLRLFDATTPILIFSIYDDPLIAGLAIKHGASGYLAKDAPLDEIVVALGVLRKNKPYLDLNLAAQIAFMEARGTRDPKFQMTGQELRILAQLGEGKSYGQIADYLNISYKTVANTGSRLKAKLGVRSLAELMKIAMEHLARVT